jgi:hypothetical protein
MSASRRARDMAAYASVILLAPASAQDTARLRPEDTEVWKPVPPVVTPGPAQPSLRPSDAIVLFDGTSLAEWVNTKDGSPAGWSVTGHALEVVKAAGNIETRRRFRDYQLHLEWLVPVEVTGSGQARGNSGVFLASTGSGDRGYELQILDSYRNDTYVNGMAGSIYKQSPPLVNASRKPGEWQSYDVTWNAPRFGPDGGVISPARASVIFNGVVVQNDFALSGETVYVGTPAYTPHGDSPIKLQAHNDPSAPLRFRNIWLRVLSGNPLDQGRETRGGSGSERR